MNKFLYQYEIFVLGKNEPFHEFESNYAFDSKEHNKLFVKKDGKTLCFIITKITHDIEGKMHKIRLNCIHK